LNLSSWGEAFDVDMNLADELVILLIFVNNENFANAATMGKVSDANNANVGL